MFGNMDDDGFFYVRAFQGTVHCIPAHRLGREWGRTPDGSLEKWAVPQGPQGQQDRARASFLVSVSPASLLQGELNGQRGLVPSNFLEGPGPEAGIPDKEPGTSQAESQVSEEGAGLPHQYLLSTLLVWRGQNSVVRVTRLRSTASRADMLSFCQREPRGGSPHPVYGLVCRRVVALWV